MKKFINSAIFLALLFLLSTRAVYAHGGSEVTYLSQQKMGSYLVNIRGDNESPQPGEIILEGTILNSSTFMPELECDLILQATRLDDGTQLVPVKAKSPGVKTDFEYLGVLNLEKPGLYQITATVVDSGGPAGEAQFTITVQRVSAWFKWVVIGLLVCYSLAGLWLLKESRRVWQNKTQTQPPEILPPGRA